MVSPHPARTPVATTASARASSCSTAATARDRRACQAGKMPPSAPSLWSNPPTAMTPKAPPTIAPVNGIKSCFTVIKCSTNNQKHQTINSESCVSYDSIAGVWRKWPRQCIYAELAQLAVGSWTAGVLDVDAIRQAISETFVWFVGDRWGHVRLAGSKRGWRGMPRSHYRLDPWSGSLSGAWRRGNKPNPFRSRRFKEVRPSGRSRKRSDLAICSGSMRP